MSVKIAFWREITNSYGMPHLSTVAIAAVPLGLAMDARGEPTGKDFRDWSERMASRHGAHGYRIVQEE